MADPQAAPAAKPAVVVHRDDDGVDVVTEIAESNGKGEASPSPSPGPSRASIEAELATINKAMRANRHEYFRDEQIQARELALLEQLEQLKAAPAATKVEAADQAVDDVKAKAAQIEQELAEIVKLRRDDRRRYLKEDVQQRERELIEAQQQIKEDLLLASALETTLAAIVDGVPDHRRQDFEAGFDAVLDELAPDARNTLQLALAQSPETPARPATDQQLKNFGSLHPELLQEWGRNAGKNVAIVRSSMNSILAPMSAGDRSRVEAWFDGLEQEEASAVLRALVRTR